MKITKFRIRKCRNIQDSGEIELNGNLTCVVGKNQSGKTVLLRALHRFNPRAPDPYDLVKDWPRGERRAKNPKQVVAEVTFTLDDAERATLAQLTSEQVDITTIRVTKDYSNTFEIHSPEHPGLFPDRLHPNAADDLCESVLPALQPNTGEKFRGVAADCATEVRRLVKEGRYTDLQQIINQQNPRLQAALTPGNPNPQHQLESQFIVSYQQALNRVVAEVQRLPTMHRAAHEYIVKRLPTFVYMDDYRQFNGTAMLEQVRQRLQQKSITATDETFLIILKLAGLDLDDLIRKGAQNDERTKRERQYDLDDAGRTLTRDVAGRWGQNPYRVEFRVDGQTFFTEIEEEGKEIGFLPLEEQSKGFLWFFSFDLRFMHDSEGTFENCILLLDEPGLHLHPGAQEDLLERLDAYAAKNTLIYSTHLPFLIDLREPSRIRVMSEQNGSAIVVNDLGAAGHDEKLTLQAAVGMRLNQHYLIAQRNLVVEGVDDFWIITELAELFARSGLDGIPDDVAISAAGGASEVVYMATFMIGQNLGVVALFDSDDEGRQAEERLRTKWLTRYRERRSETLLLGEAVRRPGDFAIEDLFPQDYYLAKTAQSHRDKMQAARVTTIAPVETGGLLVNRVAAGCRGVGLAFNKGSVAKLIRREINQMKTVDELAPETRDGAKQLFTKLGELFNRVQAVPRGDRGDPRAA